MFVPSSATLVILFKIARARLLASSQHVESLTDARLIAATEEMNKISDDIREAGHQLAQGRTDNSDFAPVRWSSDAELPVPELRILAKVAAWADLRQAVNAGIEPAPPHPRSPG